MFNKLRKRTKSRRNNKSKSKTRRILKRSKRSVKIRDGGFEEEKLKILANNIRDYYPDTDLNELTDEEVIAAFKSGKINYKKNYNYTPITHKYYDGIEVYGIPRNSSALYIFVPEKISLINEDKFLYDNDMQKFISIPPILQRLQTSNTFKNGKYYGYVFDSLKLTLDDMVKKMNEIYEKFFNYLPKDIKLGIKLEKLEKLKKNKQDIDDLKYKDSIDKLELKYIKNEIKGVEKEIEEIKKLKE